MKILKLHQWNNLVVVLLISALFLVACQTKEQKSNNKYEDFISKLYARGQFNGNILIVENGVIAYQGSFGIGNIDPIDSLHINSIFRLGSVSKQFTAMGIMLLKESGKLSYDQDIRDFIPELMYEGMTIRHLLNHASGLPDYTSLMNKNWKAELKYDDPERFVSSNQDIINTLITLKPDVLFNPGEKWKYSNTGYTLLATIIERVSGEPFDQFLKRQIFNPAKMTSTSVYPYIKGKDEAMPFRVFGYDVALNGTDLIANDCNYLNPVQGDGGIYSTVGDLMKWDKILYTEALISKETREEAYTPAVLDNGDTTNYGFGWFIKKSPSGKKVVMHGGGWVGFQTRIYREIEENNLIVILTNNSSKYLYGLLDPLKNMLHNKSYSLPKLTIDEAIGQTLINKGTDVAITEYKKLKSDSPDQYSFEERHLQQLGNKLIQLDLEEDAIKIFQLNQEEYPQSINTYNILASIYWSRGDTAKVLAIYQNALSIDSTFAGVKEKVAYLDWIMLNP